MFISRKRLAEILERLDRLETIVASATGYDKEALATLQVRYRAGSRCPAGSFGDHDFSGIANGEKGRRHAYCLKCGKVLGG